MKEQEQMARNILEYCLLNNTIHPQIVCNILQIPIPKLTEEECYSIAKNYPFSFFEIRNWFMKRI